MEHFLSNDSQSDQARDHGYDHADDLSPVAKMQAEDVGGVMLQGQKALELQAKCWVGDE